MKTPKIGSTVCVELKTSYCLLPIGSKFKAEVVDVIGSNRVIVSDKDDYLFDISLNEIIRPKSKPSISFKQIERIALKQNCVLEKVSDGYTLYSNENFVQGEFGNLNAVLDALETDVVFQRRTSSGKN
jgi:hypothetical protein